MKTATTVLACALAALVSDAAAQAPRDPMAVVAAQREAMGALSRMDGVWRGEAWTPLRLLEMTLKRVCDTDWPAGSPIPPR